ncbi:MAG: galactokinase, partial [Bacteroidota bacterium]
VGVQCGIMDQYVNIFGQRGKVLRIDCRSLEHALYPFEYRNLSIVLVDSRVSHSLASSEYNRRRSECREGVEAIQKEFPGIHSLRDVSRAMLDDSQTLLDPIVYKRCRYVVGENSRMVEACDALTQKHIHRFGDLMYLTHAGLRDDYAVSCKELDFLVDATENEPHVYGARMMGGGFGGCTINLIENDSVDRVTREIAGKYYRRFGIQPLVYVTSIRSGTAVLNVGEDARV